MRILVVGSGGREHALVWKLVKSPRAEKIFCAPGNAGIAKLAECVPIGAEDLTGLIKFAKDESIDLVVIGPEAPLTMGLADLLKDAGIRAFGASALAARIEGSKAFAKDLMKKYNIPTAAYGVFTEYELAESYIREQGGPLVIKADGLAAGKGVILCETTEEALAALDQVMVAKDFGQAGETVVIEEMMRGEEASFLVFTDGQAIATMPTSQDHKAVFDDDKGPNTGGMGAYSPAPVVTPELQTRIMNDIIRPTVLAMEKEGCPFQGILYAGLMIDDEGPRVVEFNTRFGDPECQPLMMRLKSDLLDIMDAVIDERLDEINIEWDERMSLCLVLAAGGYPGSYEKGLSIEGLELAEAEDNIFVCHAGTALLDGEVVTNGGRVLGITSLGGDIIEARERAYKAANLISWPGMFFRKDIGMKAVERERGEQ